MNSSNDEEIKIQFNYKGTIIDIQSNLDEKIEKICQKLGEKIKKDIKNMNFIYSGKTLNLEQSLFETINNIDKERKIMGVIVDECYSDEAIKNNKNSIKADHIICPICKENARIYFENFQIKISDCKNGHTSYLLFNQFEDSQKIDESTIVCGGCKNKNKTNTYNKLMYICNSCKINLCPLCQQNHDKKHNIINYEQKYYICEIHNRLYTI